MAILIELTDSLVRKILMGLPVKSLMQCICVCKSWYNLVSDPYFIRSHLIQKSADENEYLASGFTVFSVNPYMEDYYSFRCDETFLEKLKLKFQFSQTTWGFKIAGCCNGLLLMLSLNIYDSNMYLWNPSLGKIKPIPCAHATYGNTFRPEAAGLAFLPEVCDYKVIRISNFLSEVSSVAEIYSLRSDSWRRIETPVMRLMPSYKCPLSVAFVNSSFYWIGLKYQDEHWTNFIISFNMKSDTSKATDLPVACLDYGSLVGCLAVFQESLYLFAFRTSEGWSLWMMNEDCSSEMYWIKVCTFQYSQDLTPIGFMKNGDVIMEDLEDKVVSLHDPRSVSSPRNIGCEIRRGIRSSGVYTYSPSLALLDERT